MHTKVIFQNTKVLIRELPEYYEVEEKLIGLDENIKSLINGLIVYLTSKYTIINHLVIDVYNFERENFDCFSSSFPSTIELELYGKPKNLGDWKRLAKEIIMAINSVSIEHINIEEEVNNIKFYEE